MAIHPEDIPPPGPSLRKRYQQSAAGRRWLQRAPMLAAHFAEQWQLELRRPLRSSSAFVLPARGADGDLLLQVSPSPQAARLQLLAYAAWADFAPFVFRSDRRRGVLLMERVRPGSIPPGSGRLTQAGSLLRRISRLRPSGSELLALPRLVDQFPPDCLSADSWPGSQVKAQALKRLRVGPRRLLHGRFSPLGVVESREGWVLVSPRPMLGDPCYDAACWALADEPSGSARYNIQQISRRADLPEERVREVAWIVAALEMPSASPAYAARLRRLVRSLSSDRLIRDFEPPSL